MRPLYLYALVLVCSIAHLRAQEAKIPPLPPGSLLKRAPDYSTWTITYQGHASGSKLSAAPAAAGEAKLKEKSTGIASITVVKTGATVMEQVVEASGQQQQVWHTAGSRIVLASGGGAPIVCPDYGGDDIFSINFAVADFAGLGWISPGAYTGVVKYQDKDCLVFKGSVSPLESKAQSDERAIAAQAKALGKSGLDESKVDAVAVIDLQSRLPLFVQFGNEKRLYQYGTPPTEPLALPPQAAAAFDEYTDRVRRLSAPAVKAF